MFYCLNSKQKTLFFSLHGNFKLSFQQQTKYKTTEVAGDAHMLVFVTWPSKWPRKRLKSSENVCKANLIIVNHNRIHYLRIDEYIVLDHIYCLESEKKTLFWFIVIQVQSVQFFPTCSLGSSSLNFLGLHLRLGGGEILNRTVTC